MGSDRYLLKRFGLLGFLFGGRREKEPPASQPAVEQPPAGQPVGGQDLAEAIRKLLNEAYEASGYPAVNIELWQKLRSLMEGDVSVKELKSELEKIASDPRANFGLKRVIQHIISKIDELIGKARGNPPS